MQFRKGEISKVEKTFKIENGEKMLWVTEITTVAKTEKGNTWNTYSTIINVGIKREIEKAAEEFICEEATTITRETWDERHIVSFR